METYPDWSALWKVLVENKLRAQKESIETPGDSDYWIDRARKYDERVREKWQKPDASRALMLSLLEPGSSVIDIGAGTGSWSMLFSRQAGKVTAVEPSAAMREVLCDNIARDDIRNIEVVAGKWADVTVERHDYVFCSHAMYGVTDLRGFVQKMVDCAGKMCFLLIRAPAADGLIAEAFQRVWKQPNDSPNFVIAYHILLEMGIYPNVQFEEADKGYFLCSESVEAAFGELKKRLNLLEDDAQDEYLRDLLRRRLVARDGRFYWPGGTRSALMYWKVEK